MNRPAQVPGARAAVCPSTACVPGASVLGVRTAGGRLAYLPDPVVVDRVFADRLEAETDGRPESRYRFTGPCVEGGCPQWTGSACGVVDHILDEERPEVEGSGLPACGIRRECRWFAQRGAAACAVCPTIVADTGGTATYRSVHG